VPLTIKLPPEACALLPTGDDRIVIEIASSLMDFAEKARKAGRDEALEALRAAPSPPSSTTPPPVELPPKLVAYFNGRLRFDDATHTVYLDNKLIKVEHATTYNVFHFIAKGAGQHVATKEIRSRVKGCAGRLDVMLKKHLPPALYQLLLPRKGHGGGYSAVLPLKKCANQRKDAH
jgi:hypothetical protein